MQLTDADKAVLTPDEISALTAEGADNALSSHGGDEKTDAIVEAAKPDAEEAPTTKTEAEGETLSAEDLGAALEEMAPGADPEPAKLPTYDIPTTDFEAQRKDLKAQKSDALTKWSSGELSDAEYHQKVDELDDLMLSLATDRARAETLRQVNEQNQREAAQKIADAENSAMVTLAVAAKKAGTIDYASDKEAATQFDMAFMAVKSEKANVGKPLSELVNKAHKAVMAMRGIVDPSSLPAPAAETKPSMRSVPVTLAGLPNAGQPVAQDDVWEQYSRLSGPEADEFMMRQSAQVQQRLLRIADNSGITH